MATLLRDTVSRLSRVRARYKTGRPSHDSSTNVSALPQDGSRFFGLICPIGVCRRAERESEGCAIRETTRKDPEMIMRASHTVQVLVLLALLNILPMTLGYPAVIERAEQRAEECGCGDECHKCKYGSAGSRWCGQPECLKGPGEMCGGVRNKYGACGDGMYCRCNKCTGCSINTLECFSGFCPILEQLQLRHQDHMQGLQLDK